MLRLTSNKIAAGVQACRIFVYEETWTAADRGLRNATLHHTAWKLSCSASGIRGFPLLRVFVVVFSSIFSASPRLCGELQFLDQSKISLRLSYVFSDLRLQHLSAQILVFPPSCLFVSFAV